MHNHHKLRTKEPATKLPKHLDREAFLNAVSRGEIPIKIPTISNTPEEYVRNFNGIANYCNFRRNQSYKNPEMFTWTLKQQQFNTIEVRKFFTNINKHRKNGSPIQNEVNFHKEEGKPMEILNKSDKIDLKPPKRNNVCLMFSEQQLKKIREEEKEYEDKIKALIRSKWANISQNPNSLRHKKMFSITKMQNIALNDEKNSSFFESIIESSGFLSKFSQKNHFLNPFDKKNFSINKIMHYIKEKDDFDEEIRDLIEEKFSFY